MTLSGKAWGQTLDIETNPFVSFHRAEIKQGYCCSKHDHTGRTNLFFVESGRVRIRVYQSNGLEDETILTAGQMTKVGPGLKHRFECLADAVVFELYWPRLMTETDINRDDTGGRLEPVAPSDVVITAASPLSSAAIHAIRAEVARSLSGQARNLLRA